MEYGKDFTIRQLKLRKLRKMEWKKRYIGSGNNPKSWNVNRSKDNGSEN